MRGLELNHCTLPGVPGGGIFPRACFISMAMGAFPKVPPEPGFLNPSLHPCDVVVVTPTGIHLEVRITMRQIKVTDDELGVESAGWADVGIAGGLLGGTKEDVKSALLLCGAAHWDQVARPESLDIGPAPARVRAIPVVGKVIVGITGVNSQRDAPLSKVAAAN